MCPLRRAGARRRQLRARAPTRRVHENSSPPQEINKERLGLYARAPHHRAPNAGAAGRRASTSGSAPPGDFKTEFTTVSRRSAVCTATRHARCSHAHTRARARTLRCCSSMSTRCLGRSTRASAQPPLRTSRPSPRALCARPEPAPPRPMTAHCAAPQPLLRAAFLGAEYWRFHDVTTSSSGVVRWNGLRCVVRGVCAARWVSGLLRWFGSLISRIRRGRRGSLRRAPPRRHSPGTPSRRRWSPLSR